MIPYFILVAAIFLILLCLLLKQQSEHKSLLQNLAVRLDERALTLNDLRDHLLKLLQEQQKEQQDQRHRFDEYQIKGLQNTQENLQKGLQEIRKPVIEALNQHAQNLNSQVEKLNQNTAHHLKQISGEVEKRLSDGFEKTNLTFNEVVTRLALIDQAQKEITALSTNVVSLQDVLNDKKSRGAFGEVQLSALIRNMLPENNFSFQHTFSNGKRADCVLFLPEPTGNIAIDAKFPLENYRRMIEQSLTESERKIAAAQFKLDIKKHIYDVQSKYIIPNETSDGAVMFIPAEAVFAEIHAHFPELVDVAHNARVWIVSPTTMMAILSTARAVLKDAATTQQVHIIQEHLVLLSRDFSRFQQRMDNLSKHINQAQTDVDDIHKSSLKITSRFNKIEKVDLAANLPSTPMLEPDKPLSE